MTNPFSETLCRALSASTRQISPQSVEHKTPGAAAYQREASQGAGQEKWLEKGEGEWPAWYAVTDLASASIGAAAAEITALQNSAKSAATDQLVAQIDRRLASLWFDWSLRPINWSPPNPWDPVAGDYPTKDGWIKLHTNAPHHRQAALQALGLPNQESLTKTDVASVVLNWSKDTLESAVVDAGGCAAAMRSTADWLQHKQGAAVNKEPLIHWLQDGESGAKSVAKKGTDKSTDSDYPLRGLRVLDLTRVLAGPVATRFLARFGAEVLRVDPPSWEEPGVIPDVTLGKRCTGLDLTLSEERAHFERLLAGADLIVHGYRPGALDNLGYSRAERLTINPNLLDISLCAYGFSGPWAGRRGFDSLVQMSCGIANHGMQQANADKPTPLPVQALDHATGYLVAAAAVRALRVRDSEGKVVSARCSLARTAALLMTSARTSPGATFAAESEADLGSWVEHTTWGDARRIRFPVAIQNTQQQWLSPAQELRSAPPQWTSN